MRPKSLLRAIIILLAAVFILLPLSACDKDNFTGPTDTQAVYMKGDGVFKILTVTDSHINGEKSYQFLRQTLERLIDAHNPDLIVFNGDNVDAEKYLVHLEKIALFLEERQIYWAAVLGNHDREDKTYPNYVSTVSKLITIDPVTNEVDMFFALPSGYTTKDIADAYEMNKAR